MCRKACSGIRFCVLCLSTRMHSRLCPAKMRRADSCLRLPTSAVHFLDSLNGQLFLFHPPYTPCLSGRRCTVGWLCVFRRYSVPSSSERRQGPLWRSLKESAPSAPADTMYQTGSLSDGDSRKTFLKSLGPHLRTKSLNSRKEKRPCAPFKALHGRRHTAGTWAAKRQVHA